MELPRVISPKDVKKLRKRGFKAETVIREMRDGGVSKGDKITRAKS